MIRPITQALLTLAKRPLPSSANQILLNKVTRSITSTYIRSLLSVMPYSFCTSKDKDNLKNFSEFVTNPQLLNTLKEKSMSVMFPIQSATFKLILEGRDVLARDRTGSGKTLAYTLPVLQRFYQSKNKPRSIKNPKFLVLCPTRQLALQVANQIKKFTNEYKVVTVYGGASISNQIRDLERGAAIIVATPGRLIDLMDKEAVIFKDLQVVCIDEADTMLQKGFKLDVEAIFAQIKKQAATKTQNLMFSATIPPWVATLTERYLKDGATINMIKDESARTSMTVEHYALMVKESERFQTVLRLIERFNPQNRTIIFTQTKVEANEFTRYFDSDEIVVLHGDISQNVREINIGKFKKGQIKILIATDVASRGLDIPNVQLVIQLSPPQNPEPYIHRSGRTGRAGREGTNITFFDESNIHNLLNAEKEANIQIKLITDNFNITLWKKQAKSLISQISEREQSKDDPFYKLLLNQILKKVKPQDAILYFLKQKLGKIPQTTSSITNKKGYITYLAHKRHPDAVHLKEVFQGVEILNLTEEEGELKFDIVWNDFYRFEEIIEKQDVYQLQIIDENTTYTLKQFNDKYFGDKYFGDKYFGRNRNQHRFDRNYNRDRNQHRFDRNYDRDRNNQRQDRFDRNYDRDRNNQRQDWFDRNYDRDRNNQRQDRFDRNYDRDRNNQRYEPRQRYQRNEEGLEETAESNEPRQRYQRNEEGLEETAESNNIYISGIPQISKEELQEEIKNQTGVQRFRLKVITKTGENGDYKFGFIELQDSKDCHRLLKETVNVNGSRIQMRISKKR